MAFQEQVWSVEKAEDHSPGSTFEKATEELEEFQAEEEAKNLVCSGNLELNAMDGMGSCSRNCPGLI